MLKAKGRNYENAAQWASLAVREGKPITAENCPFCAEFGETYRGFAFIIRLSGDPAFALLRHHQADLSL
ncbi:MAG: hypothetical protein U1A24_16190 [Cypionkella sp.]|uniref:hypothetical protein n=1 Tax=Cypionkella sp. TaxID=2811411 RepID=UPI002ABCAAF1|nr:hypothetical protein [Cypionkella sp.]MDZ4312088.1 hypothetical protein [Cypionkella sp.]MDZ4394624.1 hypothetical protein [Cypionkella sp.]